MLRGLRAKASPSARLLCDVAAFLVPAVIYVASASHEPASWDTAELQGVPVYSGHHPSDRLSLLRVARLCVVASVAARIDCVSHERTVPALAMGAAAAAAYAVAVGLAAWLSIALCATLWFAFTQDVWSHGIRAEAQDVAVALEAFAVYCFVRWMNGRGDRWFAAAFAAFGLGLAAHPNAVWLAPGFVLGALVHDATAVVALDRRCRRARGRRFTFLSLLAVALGVRGRARTRSHARPRGNRRRDLLEL